jgi:hypothetical protein
MLRLVSENQMNAQVLEYLKKRDKTAPFFAMPDEVVDPYMAQGSHPDVVEYVWKRMGASLPMDCRCIVCGTPALLHPKTGTILAFCNGTGYCLRLLPSLIAQALSMGAKTYIKWSYGADLDTKRDLGPDWVVGQWLKDEISWCVATYQNLE